MTTPTIAEYLKYANLQMAAEAFLRDESTGVLATSTDDVIAALVRGNRHASYFTATQADDFVTQWEVVTQCPNTPTGFSGTLFRSKVNRNEYVLSLRSTEAYDDAIRDSASTNTLEIHSTGWAWGQISDMEAWYASIK
ncbi:MAG: hypothetical protein F9K30_16795, partial [Dechloromonas sp.]